MQPAVYFLNRMSEMKHMRRQKVWSVSNTGYRKRPGTGSTQGVINKSHRPWTFIWNHRGSDMELFHLIVKKCPGDVGKFRYMQVDTLYMHAGCLCWSHTQHLHSSSRDPRNIYSVFQSVFLFFIFLLLMVLNKASMMSVCQVILLRVQIMTN